MFTNRNLSSPSTTRGVYDRLEKIFYPGETGDQPYNTKNIYLREIWYSVLDYDFAAEYYKQNDYPATKPGACSSMCNDSFLARNYDWTYGNTVTFIVHTTGGAGRYKTLGVANTVELTKKVVESGKKSVGYKLLPFHTLDGINEHGLSVTTNVVPCFDDDYGKVDVVNPENPVEISTRMLVRYFLDNCKTIDEVKDAVNRKLKIYTSKDLFNMDYTQHYLIKDSASSVILEFAKDSAGVVKPVFIDGNKMTNFHIHKTDFKEDGTILTPEDRAESDTDFIEDHGAGLERYNYIVTNLNGDSDLDKVKSVLNHLNYTNAYKFIDPELRPEGGKVWYSEFSGILGLKASDTKAKYEASGVLDHALEAYNTRMREKADTWQTVHSSIYDSNTKKLYIRVEEGEFDENYLEFEM